jgi:hypothetical protein
MRRFGRPAVWLGVLCALVTAGCTTESQGEPGPATTGTAAVETTESSGATGEPNEDLPTDGAPAVSDPLDTTTFQQDPCGALTSGQSESLNIGSSGTRRDDVLGNGCEWRNAETRGKAVIAFLDKDPRGLSALYAADKDGKWAYFDELPAIEGYPAVSRSQVDNRSDGYCSVVVGVSDQVAFETYIELSLANKGQKDSCEVAAEVAGMALQTMKQGG